MAWTEMGGEVLFIENDLASGWSRIDDHRAAWRSDAGISARGAVVLVVTRRGVWHRTGDLQGLRSSLARAGRRDSERWTKCGSNDHFGAGVVVHGKTRQT